MTTSHPERRNTDMEKIEGVEVWPDRLVTCSACGKRVQVGAPSEDCCPARYDKPAPQWVRDFHAKHGVWPKAW